VLKNCTKVEDVEDVEDVVVVGGGLRCPTQCLVREKVTTNHRQDRGQTSGLGETQRRDQGVVHGQAR